MAMTLNDYRAKYPQYSDLSDVELADGLHGKFYSDIPKDEFYQKVGLKTGSDERKVDQAWQDDMAELGGVAARGAVRGLAPVAAGAGIGAGIGMMGGPFAPVTVPVGAGIGALVGGFAEPAADAAAWGFNKLRGKKDYKAPSAYVDDALDTVFPHPDTPGERMLETGAGALTSTAGLLRALGTASARAAPGAFRNVANWLRANPGSQMVSAPIAAATAQGIGEATDSPLLGTAAGVAAGTASNMRLPPRLDLGVPDPRAVRNVDDLYTGPGVTDLERAQRPRGRDLDRAYAREGAELRAGDIYDQAEQLGVFVDPQAVADRLRVMRDRLSRGGPGSPPFMDELHPNINALLNGLIRANDDAAAAGRPRSLREFEANRQAITSELRSLPVNSASQAAIGGRLLDQWDHFANTLNPRNGLITGGGDPVVANRLLRQARGEWRRMRTAETINEVMEKAKTQAAGFSQSGMDNAVRTQFRQILDNPKRFRAFNRAEQAAIRRIARGDTLQHALRYLGKFSPRSVMSAGVSTLLGGLAAGPAGVAALAGAGEASREAAARLRVRRANNLQDMVLSGRQPQRTVLGVRQPQGPLRAALEATRATDNEEDEPAGAGFAAGGLVDADDFASGIMIREGRRNGR